MRHTTSDFPRPNGSAGWALPISDFPLILAFSLLLPFQLFPQNTLGLLQYEEEAYPAYTLFSNNPHTYLIDNCGLVVQTWESNYRPGRSVHLLENGQLLRTAELDGVFPISGRGGRFELFSWEGELLWHYEISDQQRQAHHAIRPLPNGNFLALIWEKRSGEEAAQAGSDQPNELWTEAVYEIAILPNNQAEIVWTWQLWDHLVQDHTPEQANYGDVAATLRRVDLNYRIAETPPVPNWAHLNAIDYHPTLDQIVLSSRHYSEVWVIDHSTTTAEAAQSTGGRYGRGGDLLYRYGNPAAYRQVGTPSLNAQHDAHWITGDGPDADQFIVFNNEDGPERSAVKTWRPPYTETGGYTTTESGDFAAVDITTVYTAPDFYSPFMSSAQLLPNGHLFTCEASTGHFLETDPEGNIVWEYINPVNANGGPGAQGAEPRFNQTFAAQKYGTDYPAFIGKDLSPGAPVEINPSASDCFVPVPYVPLPPLELYVDRNPTGGMIQLRSNWKVPQALCCYDVTGRLLFTSTLGASAQTFDLRSRAAGIYLFVLRAEREMVVKRVVKM